MQLELGQTSIYVKKITESDILGYADLVGDYNNAHVNKEEAKKSVFGGQIAHGMLIGSYISTIFGMQLPGSGAIYLEQQFQFKKPVYVGDTITAKVTLIDILNKKKGVYKFDTTVSNQNGEKVIEGYALIKYQDN
ncbi:MAG: MaoC family dehydratase [Lachnospiraceae bacterium]|nr:MaoC family dehydratase [Lachnospiraceae bacterium]